MPSVSKSQQRLMGMAYAVKSGDMEISDIDPAYRDKVKSLSDGMTKKDLKKYASTKHDDLPETVSEAFIGPFVFNDKMSDEELKAMYGGALDGYAYYTKGMQYPKSDYKKAYQEIEKILKKRGVAVDEDFAHAAQNITPSANIGGMGPVILPSGGVVGSGDVPTVADIDDDEEEAKKDKTKKKLEMENFKLFTQFDDFIGEAFEEIRDLTKALHFETDPKRAEEMKIELGKRQGEVVTRKQIEGGNYSLRIFRKKIKYDETGEDLGVFKPGSYMAATSKLGDGPHKKAVKKIRWNQKMYDQWLEDVASNGGWEHAFDMAQNAKHERGLIDWVKKNYRGEDPMQRIQWDIEAFAESVVNESEAENILQDLLDERGGDMGELHGMEMEDALDTVEAYGHKGSKAKKIAQELFSLCNESAVTEAKLKFKVGDFIKKKKDGNLEYEIKAIKQKFNAVEVYLDVTGKSTIQTIQHINKEWELAESVVVKDHFSEWVSLNEKKEDRDGMMKFIKKHMSFVGTSEDFNGSEGGIHVSGENYDDEFKGKQIYDYYSEDYKNREFGVLNSWEKELNKRGWYSEWYDAGTVMIWPQ